MKITLDKLYCIQFTRASPLGAGSSIPIIQYKNDKRAGKVKSFIDFSHSTPYNKPIFFIKSKLQKNANITEKSITTSVSHSAGENDRHKFRTVTQKSTQTVLKNLEGFYIINIDHSENLFVYHKNRR